VEINLKKNDFQKNVLACAGVSPVRGINPVLCNILLETIGRDMISLKATDTELGIIINFPAEVVEEGKVLLNSKSLADIVRLLPSENARIVSKDSSVARLTSGKSSFRFNCLSPSDFPNFSAVDEGDAVNVSASSLRETISKTIFAVPTDQTKYSVVGGNLKISDGKLSITSADVYRLVHCYFELGSESQGTVDVILPKKAFAEIGKLLENEAGEISLKYSQNKLFVTSESKTLICQVLGGEFPNLVDAIPRDNPNTLKVNRVNLITSIRRVSVFSEDSAIVLSTLDDNTLRIESASSKRGEGSDEIDAEYSGKTVSIGFDARYITEVLNAMNEETVRIDIDTPVAPSLFRRCEDNTYSCIIMPMRLAEDEA